MAFQPGPQDEDVEFATKEDLELISKDPALQKVYNAMKAGVTKKFQDWGSQRKQLLDTLKAYEQTLQQWEEWRPVLEQYSTHSSDESDDGDDGGRSRRRGKGRSRYEDDDEVKPIIDSFKTFQTDIQKRGESLAGEVATMKRMFDLSLQLDDIRREHFMKYPDIKFDTDKVLQTALDKGYQNLSDAYDNVYRNDFIKRDVETQVKTRLDEEVAKLKAPGETGSGAQPMHFKLPDATPKNFSEASQSVLSEIKQGTLTKELP